MFFSFFIMLKIYLNKCNRLRNPIFNRTFAALSIVSSLFQVIINSSRYLYERKAAIDDEGHRPRNGRVGSYRITGIERQSQHIT